MTTKEQNEELKHFGTREEKIIKIIKDNLPYNKPLTVIKTSRPNLIRRLYDNMPMEEFIKDTSIDLERYKKVDRQVNGINLQDVLELARKYNLSLDYLYGISDYKNDEDVFFQKLLEKVPSIFQKEEDYLILSINHFLIKYILALYDLQETKDLEDYTEFEYETSKQQEYVNTYKQSLAESKNLNDSYILISKAKFDELLNNKKD